MRTYLLVCPPVSTLTLFGVGVKVKEKLEKGKKEIKHKLAKELSDIVIICQSASFKGFEHAQRNCKSHTKFDGYEHALRNC